MCKMMLAALAATALTGVAHAQNPIVILPGGPQAVTLSNGASTFAYNNPNGNTGAGTVTADQPRAAPGTPGATGSLKLTGDRSRYVIGSEFSGPSLFLLDELGSFSFDWKVTNNGSPNASNTPVVRLHVIDPVTGGTNIRSELVWEGVYSGVSNAEGQDWSTAGAEGLYFTNVRENRPEFEARNPGFKPNGAGVVLTDPGNAQVNLTLADIGQFFSDDAYVAGFSFGAGSGFGADFVGHFDNLRFDINPITFRVPTTSNVVNFEVAVAPVPEPATWAMLIVGCGIAGAAIRSRKPARAVVGTR